MKLGKHKTAPIIRNYYRKFCELYYSQVYIQRASNTRK